MSQRIAFFAALLIVLVGCGQIDPNATPPALYPTRVPFGSLPTFAAGTGPIVATQPGSFPTIPPPSAPAPTLFIPTSLPVTPIRPTAVVPTPIPSLDANWNQISAGIVWRTITFRAPSTGQVAAVLIVRLDPRYVRFKVHYQAGAARTIQQWQVALPGAVAIINTNFFDASRRPLGLVASDGVLSGASLPRNDTGVFQVVNGTPKVRSFFLEPYRNTEYFEQVTQGVPMLMVAGQVAPAFNPDINNAPSFRSVVAQDKSGRILFIATQLTPVSLTDMARFLGVSGLDINTAMNVDGGNSTQMYVQTGGPSQFTTGFNPVPVVLAAYKR
ncbi:MAG: phosphodiester glycosidase family protein [Anaerolineae bacterium]|nr:phosphodiester glycosidase family protein [Anaerolineae bacterium]